MTSKNQLIKTEKDGLFKAIRSDGRTYHIRQDRHRYFYPDEWNTFYSNVYPKHKLLFETLIQSGARISEALNIRPMDLDYERNTLTLVVTKSKAKKGQTKETGGARRSFQVSSDYIKHVRKYTKENDILDNNKIFNLSDATASFALRKGLIRAGIKDYYNFSLHNIRKTHGMWLKTLIPYSREITEGEICLRLGHDMNTFLKHYGSPSIFAERDKIMMIKILGDIYGLR